MTKFGDRVLRLRDPRPQIDDRSGREMKKGLVVTQKRDGLSLVFRIGRGCRELQPKEEGAGRARMCSFGEIGGSAKEACGWRLTRMRYAPQSPRNESTAKDYPKLLGQWQPQADKPMPNCRVMKDAHAQCSACHPAIRLSVIQWW